MKHLILSALLLVSLSFARATEPALAAEAAQKKAAADKANDEKYHQWKVTLPPEHQAWERTLEENLPAFYQSLYKAEKARGSLSAWDYVKDDPKLPRVLLIGDSISIGYTLATRKALAGKANVHRAPVNCGPTATGVEKLDIWLGDGKWDVIHFNFGIHDRATPLADYEQRLETLITRMKATRARLLWATTTPVPPDTGYGPTTPQALLEKNETAARLMKKHGIAVDDLFTFITPHLDKAQLPKDVHFNGIGSDLLGGKVAECIEATLKTR